MKKKEIVRYTSEKISKRENDNLLISRKCAEEGVVLLKNTGVLPIKKKKNIALYGAGARKTVKGGTGSGEVNERKSISIEEGLKEIGYKITTKDWIDNYDNIYEDAVKKWKEKVIDNQEENAKKAFIDTIAFTMPSGRIITKEDVKKSKTDTAIYVISRIAGEGADRKNIEGDYQLFKEEKENLKILTSSYDNVIVVINSGSIIDMSFIDEIPEISAGIYMLQLGMEGGNAIARIISGEVTPSGKLTDTIAKKYDDYPNSETFGENDSDIATEKYSEGIFVGYRYFDTFGIKPRYEFGYGLSYTEFRIETEKIYITNSQVNCLINVKNIGKKYSGKEVVQIYISAPEMKLKKEYQRLVAFKKTKELKPGEEEKMEIKFDIENMKSYDIYTASWILEQGIYAVRIGNSSRNTELVAYLENENEILLEKDVNICELQENLIELEPEEKSKSKYLSNIPVIKLNEEIETRIISYKNIKKNNITDKVKEIVDKLTIDEMCDLVCGEYDRSTEKVISREVTIPGAAGETTLRLKEKYNIQNIILSDGPAGIRIKNKYEYNNNIYYQYCTAFPSATVVAQTWNQDLVMKMGEAVGKEMEEFGITIWLAPGINIHRNPLCGRNFEYYSEDPLISGKMAASLTIGVQSNVGIGTTIKHLVCNNQESNRSDTNTVISERTLREIYLRGFEIAVKESNPMAIMTSYNRVNGVNPANSLEICTKLLRNEWDFKGIVMTDWSSATVGSAISWKCIASGNDLIMPGNILNVKNIKDAIETKKLKVTDLKRCSANIINIILKSNRYENSKSYYEYEK